jgi:hypothetical protein
MPFRVGIPGEKLKIIAYIVTFMGLVLAEQMSQSRLIVSHCTQE